MDGRPQKRMRTCIACGAKAPKEGLLRIVAADGALLWDKGGKAPGRGAYVCSAGCLRDALGKRKLSRALKREVSTDQALAIADEIDNALPGAEAR